MHIILNYTRGCDLVQSDVLKISCCL